jgi:hypothetical protein
MPCYLGYLEVYLNFQSINIFQKLITFSNSSNEIVSYFNIASEEFEFIKLYFHSLDLITFTLFDENKILLQVTVSFKVLKWICDCVLVYCYTNGPNGNMQ